MSEVEKQESQKTVVAFVTGLLIGGLLVWVFSSTPESKVALEEKEMQNSEQVEKTDSQKEEVKVSEEIKTNGAGTGSLTVADQKAGKLVILGTTEFPTKSGWVVVRENKDGVAGNILGAALYDSESGLVPTNVELVRETIPGGSYQVVFFTNEGEKGFSLSEDKVVGEVSASFKAN